MGEEKTIYVTKYALTQGIFTMQARPVDDWKYAKEVKPNPGCIGHFLPRNEFAFTKEEAVEKAEALRDKKIKSIKKQLTKVVNLNFEKMID